MLKLVTGKCFICSPCRNTRILLDSGRKSKLNPNFLSWITAADVALQTVHTCAINKATKVCSEKTKRNFPL